MKFFKSKKSKLIYQLIVFFTLILIGIFTYSSQFASFVFFGAAIGVFFILETLMSNKTRKVRLGLAVVIAIVFFLVTLFSVITAI